MSLAAVSRMTGMPFDLIKRHRVGMILPGAVVPQGAPGAAASTGAAFAVAWP